MFESVAIELEGQIDIFNGGLFVREAANCLGVPPKELKQAIQGEFKALLVEMFGFENTKDEVVGKYQLPLNLSDNEAQLLYVYGCMASENGRLQAMANRNYRHLIETVVAEGERAPYSNIVANYLPKAQIRRGTSKFRVELMTEWWDQFVNNKDHDENRMGIAEKLDAFRSKNMNGLKSEAAQAR